MPATLSSTGSTVTMPPAAAPVRSVWGSLRSVIRHLLPSVRSALPAATSPFPIPAGESRSVAVRSRPCTVLCIEGCLWVTEEANPHDYVLCRGEAFTASRRGLMVVHAFEPSSVVVHGTGRVKAPVDTRVSRSTAWLRRYQSPTR